MRRPETARACARTLRPAVFLAFGFVAMSALLVPHASMARQVETGSRARTLVNSGPCVKVAGLPLFFWRGVLANVSNYLHPLRRPSGALAGGAFPGWADLHIPEGRAAQQELGLSPLAGADSGYAWIVLRPAGNAPPLPLLVPTAFAEHLRGGGPVWAAVESDHNWRRVAFFREGGRPIGGIVSAERKRCWDGSMREVAYRDLLNSMLWSLETMAAKNGFDAARAARKSGIEDLKRFRLKVVPPPNSQPQVAGILVGTSNHRTVTARVGECLVARGKHPATIVLLDSLCDIEEFPVPGDDYTQEPERVVYMVLFGSGRE